MTALADVIKVFLSRDRLAVKVVASGDIESLSEAAAFVRERMEKLKVQPLPDEAAVLDALTQNQEALLASEEVAVLHGEPPVPPVHGRIEWSRDFFSTDFVMDPKTETVDYRRRVGDPSVASGELLARRIPPEPGEPGVDVLGHPVAPAKPKAANVRAGKQVRHEEDEDAFYAEANGRVRFQGGSLTVDTLYQVGGSIGLKTGHVQHPGALVVSEDILEGSQVRADGDIEVGGTVEFATIKAGGSLFVRGGIKGATPGGIELGGGVKARYIQEARIEAGEDIIAEAEILHSHILTQGRIHAPKARLVGGSVSALAGVDVRQAGSESSARTFIEVGEDPLIGKEEEKIAADADKLEEELAKIRAALLALPKKWEELPPDKREAVQRLREKATADEARLAEVRASQQMLREESKARAKPEVIVRQMLYPETTIRIGGVTRRFVDETQGPVRAIVDGNAIVLIPTHRS